MATKLQTSLLTETQKTLQRALDQAAYTVVQYAGAEVPAIENLTPTGLMDDLGYVNEAKKAIEKTEKILKERLRSQLTDEQKKSFRGENFEQTTTTAVRAVLDQALVKSIAEDLGFVDLKKLAAAIIAGQVQVPPECISGKTTLEQLMTTTEVDTMRIKRIGK